jgi:hypothetical protein
LLCLLWWVEFFEARTPKFGGFKSRKDLDEKNNRHYLTQFQLKISIA